MFLKGGFSTCFFLKYVDVYLMVKLCIRSWFSMFYSGRWFLLDRLNLVLVSLHILVGCSFFYLPLYYNVFESFHIW